MKIKFILWSREREDGTKTIKLSINNNGLREFLTTKYSVKESDFINNEQKGIIVSKGVIGWMAINSDLLGIISKIRSLCDENRKLSTKDIVALYTGVKPVGEMSFLDYFENFVIECEAGKHNRTAGTIRNYRKIYTQLVEFAQRTRTDFDCIDQGWYEKFVRFHQGKGHVNNTIGSHVKVVKMVLNRALDRGITKSIEHKKKSFKIFREETDSVYLTTEEIQKIIDVDLKSYPHLAVERDRFIISYCFLMRFSDSVAFTKANFHKEKDGLYLKMRSQKTDNSLIVPVNPLAKSILEKYDYELPKITNAEANWKIKEVCRKAKIDYLIECGGEKKDKCDFVTTHTARRSGATNLYLEGMDEKTIMDIGGWDTPEAFRIYIKITKLQSAIKAKTFDFFNMPKLKVA